MKTEPHLSIVVRREGYAGYQIVGIYEDPAIAERLCTLMNGIDSSYPEAEIVTEPMNPHVEDILEGKLPWRVYIQTSDEILTAARKRRHLPPTERGYFPTTDDGVRYYWKSQCRPTVRLLYYWHENDCGGHLMPREEKAFAQNPKEAVDLAIKQCERLSSEDREELLLWAKDLPDDWNGEKQ